VCVVSQQRIEEEHVRLLFFHDRGSRPALKSFLPSVNMDASTVQRRIIATVLSRTTAGVPESMQTVKTVPRRKV
jgi:hypothetical protein